MGQEGAATKHTLSVSASPRNEVEPWLIPISHIPAGVFLDVEWKQLFRDAEGQRALLHLFSHEHPLAVCRLKPVDLTYRVLEHWEKEKMKVWILRATRLCAKDEAFPFSKAFCPFTLQWQPRTVWRNFTVNLCLIVFLISILIACLLGGNG